jgi:ectoine hydroxylase-related dioxygenase (phytanoyl-CoA dioxygenase family)/SAM-dependent methyltransferase
MDHRLTISESERRAGPPGAAAIDRVVERFDERGFVVLDGLFPVDLVDGLHAACRAQFGAMDSPAMAAVARRGGPNRFLEVGPHRYEIAVQMTDAFRDPRAYAGEFLLRLLWRLLDGECHLSSFTVVVSFPGAGRQHVHRDYPHLFSDHELATRLPAHAVSVVLPLVDVDRRTGPTGVWPGSHRWPEARAADPADVVAPETRKGDCLLLDYRTLHAGMPNSGEIIRPTLYMVYSRPWFFDEDNHRRRTPVDRPVGPDDDDLPGPVRSVLTRAYTANQRRLLAMEAPGAPSQGAPIRGDVQGARLPDDPAVLGLMSDQLWARGEREQAAVLFKKMRILRSRFPAGDRAPERGEPVPGFYSRATWQSRLDSERAFWDRWIGSRGGGYSDFVPRFDPGRELDGRLARLIEAAEDAEVRLLDVGAGPATVLPIRWGGRRVTTVAIDPLADDYDRAFERHGLRPPVRTQSGEAEHLDRLFPENRFDFVYARNSLDHSYDPVAAIHQMVRVAKPGCCVMLEHGENEAVAANYEGLHQWNFEMDDSGAFSVWRPGFRVNVARELDGRCTVETTTTLLPNRQRTVTAILRKMA